MFQSICIYWRCFSCNLSTYHRVSQVLGRIVGNVEQFPILREHHQETGHGLKRNQTKNCVTEGPQKPYKKTGLFLTTLAGIGMMR